MRVLWTRPALADLDRIQDFIAADNPRAAYRLTQRLVDQAARLSQTPMIGRPGRVVGTRELVASGTPYILVYRLRDRAEILAVVHGARDWPRDF
ncbi:type II toxin-antitoxin system RelE/ParE family toxin [Jiella sp. M17.18]|uniref:type II toxin-antitoxin system RelE/ParE family toxin n=1 Tax=Jiella sp. M17.18 TaxID=3234247 RepID=UPI0034DEC413